MTPRSRRSRTAGKAASAPAEPGTDATPPDAAPPDAALTAAEARAAAKSAKRGRAAQRAAFYARTHGDVDAPALARSLNRVLAEHAESDVQALAQPARPARRRGGQARAAPAAAPMAFPANNTGRWVPIGPTVVRRGQAMSRPRVSGRIRDIAVSPDGQRAYALTAKGGIWYSEDAGATWLPVGGWAGRSVNVAGNGNMFSGGALLVDFNSGGLSAIDVVLVGTGEPSPALDQTGTSAQGGIGVLAALGPTADPINSDPWEPDTGGALLQGLGVWRLARRPGATSFTSSGAAQDRVLAATTNGLYLGTRSSLPAVAAAAPTAPMQPAQPALPVRDGYTWAACAAAGPTAAGRSISDLVWLSRGGANTRVVYAVQGRGVFFSDDEGASRTPIAALQTPGVAFANRISLAAVPGTTRVYVLAEITVGGAPQPTLWQIADATANPPVVVALPNLPHSTTNVPSDLFGDPTNPPTQAWYDHGLAVELVGANDRIYLGGSTVKPRNDAEGEWSASLWCFETPAPPAAVAALQPATGISRRGNPDAGDGADRAGLIGNNVHADVHAIRLAGPAAPNRQVWVGCDGGVYLSRHSGRVNTFAACNTGLATLEPIFVAAHPTSSHFTAAGFQDNGSQVRAGDTVWEEIFLGDGGGTVFHPIRSDVIITQYTNGTWNGTPASAYQDPLTRSAGNAGGTGREGGLAAFYSGAAVISDSATTARLALGTNRVWVADNVGAGALQWRTLPYPPATTQRDTRPGGNDPAAQQNYGVPGFVNANFVDSTGASTADQIIDMVWLTPTVLLVIYQGGLVRYTNTNRATGTWAVQTWTLGVAPFPLTLNTMMSAVAAIPVAGGSSDFYLATLGDSTNPAIETVWFFDSTPAPNGTWRPTGLRRMLDFHRGQPDAVAGPCDPCFALAVDPVNNAHVYAGTATGVWKGERINPTTWTWNPFMNGLPQATVQDLDIWQDSGGPAASPRLLRAGVQSRGVWEVDIAHDEPRRTYVRVHPRDDRRRFPTPLANPRLRPPSTFSPPHAATSTDASVAASPDIVIRPAWPVTNPPVFHSTIESGNLPAYDLWTFQTAFRWIYPSCVADGQWSDAMRDLVRFHRSVLGLSGGAKIDRDLWRHVVGGTVGGVQRGTRLKPDSIFAHLATVTSDVADSLAVYRAPWQTTVNFSAPGTEVDLLETVLPVRTSGAEWTVFREPCTVDVLLHHRDSRPVMQPGAFAVLLWRSAPTAAELLAVPLTGIPAFLAGVLAGGVGHAAPAAPGAGWNVATNIGGVAWNALTSVLDARLPRAVSIDVNLSDVPSGHRVLLLALVGSTADDPISPPVGAPVSVADLVQAWPHAALRIVRVTNRV